MRAYNATSSVARRCSLRLLNFGVSACWPSRSPPSPLSGWRLPRPERRARRPFRTAERDKRSRQRPSELPGHPRVQRRARRPWSAARRREVPVRRRRVQPDAVPASECRRLGRSCSEGKDRDDPRIRQARPALLRGEAATTSSTRSPQQRHQRWLAGDVWLGLDTRTERDDADDADDSRERGHPRGFAAVDCKGYMLVDQSGTIVKLSPALFPKNAASGSCSSSVKHA